MGIRTHLDLFIVGDTQDVGSFKNLPTNVYLINNHCIGKRYFAELPDEIEELLEEKHDYPLWHSEDNCSGEIKVGAFITMAEFIETRLVKDKPDEEPWYTQSLMDIATLLKKHIAEGNITPEETIKYSEY